MSNKPTTEELNRLKYPLKKKITSQGPTRPKKKKSTKKITLDEFRKNRKVLEEKKVKKEFAEDVYFYGQKVKPIYQQKVKEAKDPPDKQKFENVRKYLLKDLKKKYEADKDLIGPDWEAKLEKAIGFEKYNKGGKVGYNQRWSRKK